MLYYDYFLPIWFQFEISTVFIVLFVALYKHTRLPCEQKMVCLGLSRPRLDIERDVMGLER